MSFFVPVVLVVLGDGELGVYDLLNSVRLPFIEEVFLWLLAHLLPHIPLDTPPRPIVVHARAEYIERAERFAVEFPPSQQIGYEGCFPAARVCQKKRSHGGTG